MFLFYEHFVLNTFSLIFSNKKMIKKRIFIKIIDFTQHVFNNKIINFEIIVKFANKNDANSNSHFYFRFKINLTFMIDEKNMNLKKKFFFHNCNKINKI